MSIFERYLSAWIALAIAIGVLLGTTFPSVFETIAALEYAHVNIVIAALIWLMILPMMLQIDFSSIKDVGKNPRGLILTVIINWLIKPFTMAGLGILFFQYVFKDFVSPETAEQYIAGMILLGVAPCTAMVFVWSQLTKGDANYTLVQVSVNDIIMIFAFAPIAALLLGVTDVHVPWNTLILSVTLYVLLPFIVAIVLRQLLPNIEGVIETLKPFSIIGLISTVVILFALQANTLLEKPLDIVLIAIPLLIQTYAIFFIGYWLAKRIKLPHNIAAPSCLIGTSNFFELAVAVAISLFGLKSGAALATVVGVLVEVPVMLSLVAYVNRTKDRFEH